MRDWVPFFAAVGIANFDSRAVQCLIRCWIWAAAISPISTSLGFAGSCIREHDLGFLRRSIPREPEGMALRQRAACCTTCARPSSRVSQGLRPRISLDGLCDALSGSYMYFPYTIGEADTAHPWQRALSD